MKLERKVIGEKDPSKFTNLQVHVQRVGNVHYVPHQGEPMNFGAMAGLRKPVDPETIAKNLARDGHLFANMGVSAFITVPIGDKQYLLTVKQDRPDFDDSVAKLVSGYAEGEADLTNEMNKELREEVTAVTGKGKVVAYLQGGKVLLSPFFTEISPERQYTRGIEIVQPADFRGRVAALNLAEPGQSVADNADGYFHAPTNSAQGLFSYRLVPVEGLDLLEDGCSLIHTEDKFNQSTGGLNVELHPEGILLIELNQGELTDRVFTLTEGQLNPVDPRKVTLSEAFCPRGEYGQGIVTENNISLINYLDQ